MNLFEQMLAEEQAQRKYETDVEAARDKARKDWIQSVMPLLAGAEVVTLRGDYARPIERKIYTTNLSIRINLGSDISAGEIVIALDPAEPTPVCRVTVDRNRPHGKVETLYAGSDPAMAAEAFLRELVKHVYIPKEKKDATNNS